MRNPLFASVACLVLVWMPFPDEKGALVYERDGEIVEVIIRSGEGAGE